MPIPDGGFDPTAVATANSNTSSAQKSLWDLNGLDADTPIIVDNGTPARQISKNLDPYDRSVAQDAANKAAIAPTTGPVGDLVKLPIHLYASDPKQYLQLQQALFAAGFYGATPAASIPWGSDPQGSTYDAYKKVLAAAQQAQSAGFNITPTELLADAVKRHEAATAGATVPKPGLVIQTTDPAVLAGLVQQAAQSSLGRNLSKDEVDGFVRSFHEQEAAYSKKAYAAQQDQAGGTHQLTQPSAQAQAQEFVDDGHPTEAGGNRLADYVGVIHQLLGG